MDDYPYSHGDPVSVRVGDDDYIDVTFCAYTSDGYGTRWAQVDYNGHLYYAPLSHVVERRKPTMWEVPSDVV